MGNGERGDVMRCLMVFVFSAMVGVAVSPAQAAIVWNNGNKIVSVAYFWDGSNDVVEVVLERAVPTTCAGMATTNKVSYWYNGISVAHNIRYANAEAASAAGGMVDVRYDNAGCDTRYGAAFHGVRHRSLAN